MNVCRRVGAVVTCSTDWWAFSGSRCTVVWQATRIPTMLNGWPTAHRGPRAGSLEVAERASRSLPKATAKLNCTIGDRAGELVAQGSIIQCRRARRPGPASAASRSLQKIVGGIVGRCLELGANTYRVLVHSRLHRGGLVNTWFLGPTPIRAGEGLRAPVAMVVSPRPERAGQADQDGRPSGAARAAIDLSVVRGVGSSTVVRGSVGSYRPVIAGAKLREGITTILPRGESAPGSRLVFNVLSPHWRGTRRRQRWTRSMVHGKNRIPYRIDRRLTGLAGPDYAAPISFGLPIEPEDSQYGESRF